MKLGDQATCRPRPLFAASLSCQVLPSLLVTLLTALRGQPRSRRIFSTGVGSEFCAAQCASELPCESTMSGRIAVDDPPAPERTLQNTWRCKRPQMLRTHPKSFTIALSRINLRLAGASRNASDCSIRLKDIVSSIT